MIYRFLRITFLFEGGLAALALLVGWLTGFSPWYGHFHAHWFEQLSRDVLWGVLATAPAVAILLGDELENLDLLRGVKIDVRGVLQHYLTGATHSQLLFIAVLAGVGEELLFRGLIQAGLANLLPASWALIGSLLIASVIFGACHYLSHTYFVLATIAGLYFGLLMIVSGSLLPAIIAHALYDYVALAYMLGDEHK